MCVAHYARIRGATCNIFFYKIVDHKISKFTADIQYIMRKSMLNCRHSGIVKTIQVAATGFFFTGAARCIIPCFHGNSYYIIPLLIKHESRNGTVDTATHSNQNFSFTAHDKKLKGANIRRDFEVWIFRYGIPRYAIPGIKK